MNEKMDMAVVAAHFNFPGFQAPRRNLHRFVRYIQSLGAKVCGVEIVLKNQQPITTIYPDWRQIYVDENYAMWQKEALWNHAVKFLPAGVKKVLCCDTDIWCEDPLWLEKVGTRLNDCKVVHPFRFAHQTKVDGSIAMTVESVITAGLSLDVRSHPGYAWAFDRSLWSEGPGLWDGSIGGNGDRFLAYAIMAGEPMQQMIADNQSSESVAPSFVCDAFAEWAKEFRTWMGDSFHFVDVNIFHEYHGSKMDRQYMTRRKLLAGVTAAELARDAGGLWHWTERANPLRSMSFMNYFSGRREDG